jgi:hypothetical protein
VCPRRISSSQLVAHAHRCRRAYSQRNHERKSGKTVHRKVQVGTSERYRSESAAKVASDSLRLTINHHSKRRSPHRTTVSTLWEHLSAQNQHASAVSANSTPSANEPPAVSCEVSHSGRPMRCTRFRKRESERTGSKPGRNNTPGLNRSS